MKKSIVSPNEAEISHSQHHFFSKKDCDNKEFGDVSNDEMVRGKILGIDYGRSKIGLALADNETKIAFAYATLENNKEFMQNLAGIIKKESVNKIIIGVPTFVNRKKTLYEGEVLGKRIKKIFPDMDIEYQNEMFTTKIAQANLIAKGVKGIKKFDDQEAAKIILQEWLDKPYNT